MVRKQFRLMHVYLLPLLIYASNSAGNVRPTKVLRPTRQVSLGAIIDGALNLVRPMIDTSKPLQDNSKIPKQLSGEQVSYRESEILGSPRYSSLQEVPICRGNSALCSFISCTARNFKNDQSFANLNLAAQVLADTKLRKGISRDPDALLTVCHEQGLSKPECKLFAKGFQLVDKFFTTIESKDPSSRRNENYPSISEAAAADEEMDAPPIPIRPPSSFDDDSYGGGSRTWSSLPKPIEPILSSPVSAFPSFPTLPPLLFTLPTLPTFPPFIPPKPNNVNSYSFNSNNNNNNNNNNENDNSNNSNNDNDNHYQPHLMDLSSKTTKNPFFLSSHFDNDILHTAFTAPLNIFSNLHRRFQRSVVAAALKLSESVDDESLDFVDEKESGQRQKRSEYYDQVENEATNDKTASEYNVRHPNTRLINGDEKMTILNRRAFINDKSTYRKPNGYENCFRYLDQSELRLF